MSLRHIRGKAAALLIISMFAFGACSDDGDGEGGEPSGTTSAAEEPTFVDGPCPEEVAAGVDIRCGTIAVPADHDAPGEGTIDLAVAVLPASGAADDEAAPLVVLGGGPGEHTLEPLLSALTPDAPLVELTEDRPLVLLDQRGMGASDPALECPEYLEAAATVTETTQIRDIAIEAFTACHQRLTGEGVDLSAFDTAANVRDLDLVRRALRYDKVSLFGTSYGARLALQATRAFPDTIESAVLSSPIPAEVNFLVGAAASFDDAIVAVSEACEREQTCAASYSDVAGTTKRLVEQFDAQPAMIESVGPDGAAVTFAVDGATLATVMFTLFYLPNGPAMFPFLVSSLAADPDAALGELVGQPAVAAVSHGAQLSFFCAEEAEQSPPEFEPGVLGVGQRLVDTNPIAGSLLWELCDVWDVEPADPETFEPVETDVPLLVVTGQFDQITPPSYGETVAQAATIAWYVEVAGVGHSPLLAAGPCGAQLLRTFVASPHDEPDFSCVPTAPHFLTPEEAAQIGSG